MLVTGETLPCVTVLSGDDAAAAKLVLPDDSSMTVPWQNIAKLSTPICG